MSESLDDILRELDGISFAEGDDPPEEPPAGHTASVTETLRLVQEILGEAPAPRPEPPEPVWEDPLRGGGQAAGLAADGPEEAAGDAKAPAEPAPQPEPAETIPFSPQPSAGSPFTPVVRMGGRLRSEKGRSRRETAAKAGETRRFSPDPALQRGKLAGGAGLQKMTRSASARPRFRSTRGPLPSP